MGKYRTGRMTDEEIEFIEQNYLSMTANEIAERLSRKASTIRENIKKIDSAQSVAMEYDIQHSPHWMPIKAQLTKEEQQYFLIHWREIISQFKQDVTKTERMQIVDLIMNEIQMNRVGKVKQQITEQIAELREEIKKELDPVHKAELRAELANCYAAQDASGKEWREIHKEKEKNYKALKGTRDQRVKRLESSNQSFNQWMARIREDTAYRKELGEYIEKMRLASDNVLLKWSEYHKYIDGTVDQPVLTPENAKEDNI